MKRCSHCKKLKAKSKFHKHKKASDGLNSWCKDCSRENTLRYYHAHTEECKQRQYEWRKKNPERWAEINRRGVRKWRLAHPEEDKERKQRWVENNREHCREYDRQYRLRKKLKELNA